MYYDVDQFPFLKDLLGKEGEILNELLDAQKNNSKVFDILNPVAEKEVDHYTQWWGRDNGFHEEQIGIDIRENADRYHVLTIWKKGFPIKHFDAPLLFPKLLSLTEIIPNKYLCALIQSKPKSVLHTHTHT